MRTNGHLQWEIRLGSRIDLNLPHHCLVPEGVFSVCDEGVVTRKKDNPAGHELHQGQNLAVIDGLLERAR